MILTLPSEEIQVKFLRIDCEEKNSVTTIRGKQCVLVKAAEVRRKQDK
jgi:hypothetical protein